MQACRDDRAFAAFFRLVRVQLGTAAAGYFEWRPDAFRLQTGTPALQRLRLAGVAPDPGAWQALPTEIGRALAAGTAAETDAYRLGFRARFCALHPVAGAPGDTVGFVAVFDPRPRRLRPAMREALADCATVFGRILAAGGNKALHDGLADRVALSEAVLPAARAHREIEAARSAVSAGGPSTLMMLDLNRFRAVNEALGAEAGDVLLSVTQSRLEAALGTGDRLVPLDGDRFVAVSPTRDTDAEAAAFRLLEQVSRPITLAGQTVVMQASIGIVAGVPADLPLPVLLTRAETALRRAKLAGSNRVVTHGPHLDAAALEKSQLELELSNAAANGEMHLVYQPYVDLDSGRVSGVEALVRWRHPRRGAILPGTFIPLAEATGLILPLGSWTLRTACRQAARWPGAPMLSVNISALQFHQPSFTEEVDAALRDSGFPPERLELEITETVLMQDRPETIAQLEALIARGIRIALDDFGTGYSALAYLARLPHHRIKLDKSFVQDLGNPATSDLMRAIIAMARAQGLSVTAEGVERPEQVRAVRAMGFTHAQGYATGFPVADPTPLLDEDRLAAVL